MPGEIQTATVAEVIAHVRALHTRSQDLEEGMLVHRLMRFHRYLKVRIPVAGIATDESCLFGDRLKESMERISEHSRTPPIVMDMMDKRIIDGNYRVVALKRLKVKEVDAFVGVKHYLNHSWLAVDEDALVEQDAHAMATTDDCGDVDEHHEEDD